LRKEHKYSKIFISAILPLMITGLMWSCEGTETERILAPSYGTLSGDIDRGRDLFNDPVMGGGSAGKSCNSCHPGGRGVEKSGYKREFSIIGEKQHSLEEAVNFCIVTALKGTPIDPDGQDMMDIVSYIMSMKD
jgi:hypothetical protein